MFRASTWKLPGLPSTTSSRPPAPILRASGEGADMSAEIKHEIPRADNAEQESEFWPRVSAERDDLIGDDVVLERPDPPERRVDFNQLTVAGHRPVLASPVPRRYQ
jgi:hypothetical protein